MKNNVLLTIISKQTYNDTDEEDISTFKLNGNLFKEGDCFKLSYEYSDLTNKEVSTTYLEVFSNKAIMRRYNKNNECVSDMVIDESTKTMSTQKHEGYSVVLGVSSSKVSNNLKNNNGSIKMVYNLDCNDKHLLKNHLEIKVKSIKE